MADEVHGSAGGRTLFVRNLPLTTTNEKLEDAFGNVGPLKKCFVVKEKGKDICKGYGYITYSLKDDAVKAKNTIKILGGRKLQIDFADKKSKRKQRIKAGEGKKIEKSALESSDEEEETEGHSPTKAKTSEESPRKLPGTAETRPTGQFANQRKLGIIDIADLPSGAQRTDLDEYLKGTRHMLNLKFPIKGEVGKASVMYTNKATAMNAFMLIKNRSIKGCKLKLEVRTQAPVTNLKRARLIVRNLSFKCNEDKLKHDFAKFGEVLEVKIPTKPDGKKIGCAFVQFANLKDAATAVKEMNLKEILGRPVAVDWALDKDRFSSLSGSASAPPTEDSGAKSTPSHTPGLEVDSDSDDDSESSEDDQPRTGANRKTVAREDDSSDSDEDEIEEDSDEDDSGDDDQSEGSDDEESDDDDDDLDDDSSDSDDELDSRKKPVEPKRKGKNELDETKTVFIRNLSFDTEEDELEEYLSQFGDVEYCRIVRDCNTDHSKGTAFAKFTQNDSAEKCIVKSSEEQAEGGGLFLDKRKLYAIKALPREKAEEMSGKKKKEKEDKRNLYLVREGMIRAGTGAAEGLSKADLAKRMKVEQVKRQKLKNGNVFVSKTRLCVRNIPVSVDDQELKKIYLKHAGDRKARIKECRIMRDLTQVNTKGKAKSRGYAFVEFTEHQHALNALRNTNNNPEVFGESKRLIVEFSLENRVALEAKKKRMERSQVKTGAQEGERPKYEKTTKQPSQGQDASVAGGAEPGKKGPKGLPSHWGPKVRHKPRRPLKTASKPKDKLSREESKKRKGPAFEGTRQQGPPPAKKQKIKQPKTWKPQKRNQTDDFDSLVNKYKKKMMGKGGQRGSWYTD